MIDILKEIFFILMIVAIVVMILSIIPPIRDKIGKKGDIITRAFFIVVCLTWLILERFF